MNKNVSKLITFVGIASILYSCQPKQLGNQTTTDNAPLQSEKYVQKFDDEIEALVQKMSIEEKVGQMTQIDIGLFLTEKSKETFASGPNAKIVLDTAKLAVAFRKYKIGSVLNGFAITPQNWVEIIDQIQKFNYENTNLNIPIIYGVDHVHGSDYVQGGTVFPHNITLGNSFNPELAKVMGEVTAKETAHLGHHWVFAPVLGIGRNKYWPRFYETFGEDPLVCGTMGSAFIKGLQSTKVGSYQSVACAKHYLGYTDPKAGWDRTPAEISPQALYELFLPSFKNAVDAGVKTFMINSGEINGMPVHANKHLLTDVLRNQLHFEGIAISDYEDIISLWKGHRIATDEKEATRKGIEAGLDMSMVPVTYKFCDYLVELVNEGTIPMERIDLSVKRILQVKKDMGLFDTPYPTLEYVENIGTEANKELAQKAAEESIVLIKNENELLPLAKDKKILVTGPKANRKPPLLGGWSYTWEGKVESFYPNDMKTVSEAMIAEFNEGKAVMASTAKEMKAKASACDAIVFVAGEESYSEGFGSFIDLDLDANQINWIEQAIATGKPIVLVLLESRPRTIWKVFDRLDAVMFAGNPGLKGADAIANLITGDATPSAKMCFTYPWKQGHMLNYYHRPSSFSFLHTLSDELNRYTIAPFGHGLTYTRFEYKNLTLSDTSLSKNGSLEATITVTNTGEIAAKESVLWFISDKVGTYTRPNKLLKHFEKELINPGETKTFSFTIKPEHLSYPDSKGNTLLEVGEFEVKVGQHTKTFWLSE